MISVDTARWPWCLDMDDAKVASFSAAHETRLAAHPLFF